MMDKIRDFHEEHKPSVSLALLVIFIILPFVVKQILILRYICTVMTYTALVGPLNVINGYSDQTCLGQAGFFAISAYTCASPSKNLGINLWIVLPIAGVLAALVGLIISPSTLKLSGIYLSIITLGASEIVRITTQIWTPMVSGVLEIKQISYPDSFRLEMFEPKYYYFIFLIIGMVLLFVAGRVLKSRVGHAWAVIREDQVVAESLGVGASVYKCMNFMYGTFWAEIIEVAYTPFVNCIEFSQFIMDTGFNMLVMVVIDGQGALLGSTLGSAIVAILIEAPRFLENWRYVTYISITILMMWVCPQGLMDAPDSIFVGGETQKKSNGRKGKKTPEVKKA